MTKIIELKVDRLIGGKRNSNGRLGDGGTFAGGQTRQMNEIFKDRRPNETKRSPLAHSGR